MAPQRNRWLWLGLLSLCLLLFASRSLAHDNFSTLSSTRLDGKVANLEISIRQLQREMGQLRSLSSQQDNRSRQSSQATSQTAIATPARTSASEVNDEQFKNLANLVIELKQEVNRLEHRIKQLESAQN